MYEIGRRVVFRPLFQLADNETRRKARDARRGERADDFDCGGNARGVVAFQTETQFAHQPLKRQITCPARHRVVTEIDEAARLETPINEAAYGVLGLLINPGIDAMDDDVVELGQFEVERRGKFSNVKKNIRDRCLRREPARMVDMYRHGIDAMEHASRMCRGEDGCRDTLAAAEVAPSKIIPPDRGLDPGC